jgi:hypothetical protein
LKIQGRVIYSELVRPHPGACWSFRQRFSALAFRGNARA